MAGQRLGRRSRIIGRGEEQASRSARFLVGGERFLVVSFPLPSRASAARGALSKAEKEVLALLAEGLDNRTIGARRGTSVRTVANQLASIFRKLGVSSRQELAARLPSFEQE